MAGVTRAACAALLVLGWMLAPAVVRAQPAPYHRYHTLDTPHFRVHVAEGLEREGRVAGAAAERAYVQLARELVTPRGPIELVVSDDADYSNGFATPFPTNRIVIFATPPVENRGLRLNADWLSIVITHELTHIFHLDRSRGLWAVAQGIFGRAPFLFPNSYGPSWITEGLAVYYESRLTTGGRLADAEHRMIARAAAREHLLPRLDQLSVGTSRFPGGQGAYAYGSLFIDYLARTRGDSAIGRFVETQSAQLIPFMLDRAAREGFGISFTTAFDAWRDSVQRSAGANVPPLPGWRELTTHGYYASSPRWMNDSTLVYTGTDGRETNAAYALTLNGARRRLGRRDASGANDPLATGGLLYAQFDFTAPSEMRSDLYRASPEGSVTRLTRNARLIQPDARADGTIVAVELAAARSSLVLLNADGTGKRTLRTAGADETWSEPRWSPDGRRIATVHRQHGGEFSIELLTPGTASSVVLDRGAFVLSSPSWSPDGERLLYTTEKTGSPQLAVSHAGSLALKDEGGIAVLTPELSPSGARLAATTLRADGYHVGVAPALGLDISSGAVPTSRQQSAFAPVDTEPLATGVYRPYHAWQSAWPRYWYPIIEAGILDTRLGATTSGSDVLGRHLYSAYAAVQTTGRFSIAGIGYRYAGFRRPYVDLGVSQDWTSLGTATDANGTPLGTVLKRTQDASLALTYVTPHVRTYTSLTAGLGAERRTFATDPASLYAQLDPSFQREYTFPRAFVGAVWTNTQRPPLSISPEDGVTFATTVRERLRTDAPSSTASASVVGTAQGYKSLDLPGFAHHVLALRLAGGVSDRRAATALEVGGTNGNTVEIIPGYTVGEGRKTFGVRGFPTASVYGTSAVAASLEYRAPLTMNTRGLGLLPFFLDHSSLTAFGDAGTAFCASAPLYAGICSPAPLIGRTIASVGAELGLAAAVLDWDTPQQFRLGVAFPVAGRELIGARTVSAYLAFGLSY
jgi:hypothetical protein